MSSINTNVYYSPSLDIINPSENVLDLGIIMSRNCSFDVHINILCTKCTDLSGWILRTFTSRGAYVGAVEEMTCVVCGCCRGGIVVMDVVKYCVF